MNHDQLHMAMNYVNFLHPRFIPFLISYRANFFPFIGYLFTKHAFIVQRLVGWQGLEASIQDESTKLGSQCNRVQCWCRKAFFHILRLLKTQKSPF